MIKKRLSLVRCPRCRRLSTGRALFVVLIIFYLLSLSRDQWMSMLDADRLQRHRSSIYDLSDSFVMTNLIDQFLDSNDPEERGQVWSLIAQSWSKSFNMYIKRTEMMCPSALSALQFIERHLSEYKNRLFVENVHAQRYLTGFGLFFDYHPQHLQLSQPYLAYDFHLSSCLHFELITLLMKLQLLLHMLNIEYFMGRNTLIGALRHHDIVPWHSIIELNLPLKSKERLLTYIDEKFSLHAQQVNETYVRQEQIGLIYKIFTKEKSWPQIEIYFYDENAHQIFDVETNQRHRAKLGQLQKTDICPFHLRPFGPILLYAIRTSETMVSNQQLQVCEINSWNHQTGKAIDHDQQWRVPCKQLESIHQFVQSRASWRRGFCEETLKTKHRPYRMLSYFRYACQSNRTQLSNDS
jgi:hypothetical protein